MDGKAFRKMAGNAVNSAATMLDDFPGMGVTVHITGRFGGKHGTLTVGIDYDGEEDDIAVIGRAENDSGTA